MLPKVILIIGLPGSGKTYKANELHKKLNGIWVIKNDPKSLDELLPYMECKTNLIITDPNLCNSINREDAISFFRSKDYMVELMFFEHNIEKCKRNLQYRNDNKVISKYALEKWIYDIPKWIVPLKIWQSQAPSAN
jgi:hypothetical protein